MPIIDWHYERVGWLPCPDCWDEREYEAETHWVIDSMGRKAMDENGEYLLDPDFPDLDDPMWSKGHTVEVEYNEVGVIIARLFKGCPTCGGSGENQADHTTINDQGYVVYGLHPDGTFKNWYDWAFGDTVVDGSGKVHKDGSIYRENMV